jgi:hypothetical protein
VGLVDVIIRALPRFKSAVSRGYKGVRLPIALGRIEPEKFRAY